MARRLDSNHDGFITRDEVQQMRRRSGRSNRDRSDFTILREEGFPLNVNPEVVAVDEANLGDDDHLGQWRALHPETTVYVKTSIPHSGRFTKDTFRRLASEADGPVRAEDLVVGLVRLEKGPTRHAGLRRGC